MVAPRWWCSPGVAKEAAGRRRNATAAPSMFCFFDGGSVCCVSWGPAGAGASPALRFGRLSAAAAAAALRGSAPTQGGLNAG